MKQIKLNENKFVLVDDEDFEYLNQWKWHFDNNGYASRNIWVTKSKSKRLLMHRVIMKIEDKSMPFCDHADRNKLNCQKSNLRLCNIMENNRNRSLDKMNKSGYRGVDFDKKANKYRAQISVNNKKKCLGYFSDPIAAAKAYDDAAKLYFGEFANLNGVEYKGEIYKPKELVKLSKFRGVSKSYNKWRAFINFDGFRLKLGSFTNEVDAARAYNEAAIKYHGEFARLNEIPEWN